MTLRAASPSPPSPHLTPEEAIAYLKLSSRNALYQRVKRGLPVLRMGRSLRFDRRDLDAWLHDPTGTFSTIRTLKLLAEARGDHVNLAAKRRAKESA